MTDNGRQVTDEQLMLAYQAGSHTAFEQLYSRHKGPLYRFLLRHGIDQDRADELYQDIWAGVIKSRKSWKPNAMFTTWLYQIARNRLVDHYRKHKEHLDLVDEMAMAPENDHKAEQRKTLMEAIPGLPFPQRQSLLLYLESGLSMAAIAEITDTSHEAVKSRIRYAVSRLKQWIGAPDES